MKMIVTALVMSFTASAFACPNLTGNYPTCISDNEAITMSDVKVSQKTSNGVTTYTIASNFMGSNESPDIFRADGRVLLSTTKNGEKAYTQSSCDGQVLTGGIFVPVGNQLQKVAGVEYTKISNKELYMFMEVAGIGAVTFTCK